MTLLLIDCPHCHAEVHVPSGVQTTCPRCRQRVIAEASPQVQKAPVQCAPVPVAAPQLGCMEMLVIILVGGVGWGLWGNWTRPAAAPRPPSDYAPAATPAVQPSLWDGSVSEAKRFVEKSVRDPSSIKYHEWKNFSAGSRHITTADITATNGFGGPSRSRWVFSFDKSSGALKTVLVDGRMILDQ